MQLFEPGSWFSSVLSPLQGEKIDKQKGDIFISQAFLKQYGKR